MSRELTRQEKAAIRYLVKRWCANYDKDAGCLSSFANNTAKNSSGDILAIPPEQRDNNSGGSPYVP